MTTITHVMQEAVEAARKELDDPVNHPQHYLSGGMEAIDVIEAFFAHNYHLGNVFKYLARSGKKDDIVQDLEKAAWYLARAIDREKAL